MRVNCVVPDWIATDRAKGELAAMTPEARAAEAPLVDPDELADAVVELVATTRSPGASCCCRAASRGGCSIAD